MTAPKQHAKFAASASKRWMNCPSSLVRIEAAPPEEENQAGITGTYCHELMEVTLQNGLTSAEAGLEFVDDPEVFTDDMVERVQGFVDYVWKEFKKYPKAKLLVERKVFLDKVHPFEAFGTVDVAIVEDFGTLHIIDYKDGFEWVHHVDNTQMLFYALGICYEEGFDFHPIKTTIYQPKTGKDGEVYEPRTDEFSVHKLKRYEQMFIDAVAVCESATADSHLQTGSHCRWCPAKIDCPAITTDLMKQAQLDFGDVVQPAPKSLTSDQLKAVLDRSAYLKLWIKEVEKYAEEQVRAGKKIDGWGLVPTKSQRVWRDVDQLLKWDHKHMTGINQFLVSKELVTPAQAEKKMKANKVPKEVIEKFLNDNVVSVSSGDKLSQINNDYDVLGLDDLNID